jgi:hypothetical protein
LSGRFATSLRIMLIHHYVMAYEQLALVCIMCGIFLFEAAA